MTMKLLTLVALLTLAAVPARAQQGCARTASYAEQSRTALAPLFYSSDQNQADVRGTAIQLLSASDSSYVVHTDSICTQVLAVAVAYMRQYNTTWAAGNEGNYVATVFRFGPYYAVTLAEARPPVTYSNGTLSGFQTGRSQTLVYSAPTLTLVRALL
jgi:hypothetical protein